MICLEGNIGAGKSEVLKILKEKEFLVKSEPVEKWTLLDKFYKDPEIYAFPLQLQILASYADANQNIIYERSAFSGLKVFSELLYDSLMITKHQYDLLTLCTLDMIHTEPKIIIYLDLDSEECLARIRKRDRKGEENITLEYLEKISKKYEIFLHDMKDVDVKIIRIQCKDLTPTEISEKVVHYLQ